MPVWLDAIPEKAAKVRRPDTRRWLFFLVFFLLGGMALTLWNWTTERTGFVFWFTALGLPFCLWGLIFSLRRFAYKAEQVAADSRNRARDNLIKSEIRRGQRCAWILGSSVQVSAGNKPGQLLAAVARATPLVDTSIPRGGTSPIRYAALSDFQVDLNAALENTLSKLANRIQDVLAPLPDGIPCWLMLDCDSDMYSMAETLLKNALSAKSQRIFRLASGTGLAAFDTWLDKRWEHPGLFISVTLSIPSAPREGDADAVTMLVLSNRRAAAYPGALRLHRPEKGTPEALNKTLERALLWAALPAEALNGSYFTGPALTEGGQWNTACEDNGVTFSLAKENIVIDSALGYAGRASPWLASILAESAFDVRGPQVIAAHPVADKDEIWVTVITKETRKESPGND